MEALASAFELAARLVIRELDEPAFEALRSPEVRALLEGLEPAVTAWLDAPWTASRADDEAAAYAELFLIPRPSCLSLRVGDWLPEDQGDVAARLAEVVAPLGYDPTPAVAGNLPPDHLGVVLALAGALAAHPPSRSALPRLLARLLAPWIADFEARLREVSVHPLYRAAARLILALTREA